MMRTAAVIAGGLLALGASSLGACKPEPLASEPTQAEQVSAAPAVSDAEIMPVGPLSAVDLRRVCRAGLAAVHDQEPMAIAITGLEGQVVNAQWRAPVDGGLMKAQCRTDGNLVTWKPLELPDPADIRWMNQAGDPVNTFAIKGDVVTVTQTYPDATIQAEDFDVPATQEAV